MNNGIHLKGLFGLASSCSAPAHLFPLLVEGTWRGVQPFNSQTDSSSPPAFHQAMLMTHPCFIERLLLFVLSLLYFKASTPLNLWSFEASPVQGTLSEKFPMSDTNSDLSIIISITLYNDLF